MHDDYDDDLDSFWDTGRPYSDLPPLPTSTPHHYHLFTSLEQVTNAPEKSLTCSQIQSRADIYAIISQSISDSPNLVDCTGYFIVIQTSLIKSK